MTRLPSPTSDPGRLWEQFASAYGRSRNQMAVDRFLGALASLNPTPPAD